MTRKVTTLDFLKTVSFSSLFSLWDQNHETSFFLKDTNGVLVFVNNALVCQYHLQSKSDIIGKTDFDILPWHLAAKYRNDDLHIQETGQPMPDIYEMVVSPSGSLRWSKTSKYPVFDTNEQIIAIQGTMDYLSLDRLIMQKATKLYYILPYIDEHYSTLTVTSLANALNLSVRSLQRYFKLHLNMTPIEFVTCIKLQKACEQLKNGKNLQTVSRHCGFCDQSYFTRVFHKHFGIYPKEYIKKYCRS